MPQQGTIISGGARSDNVNQSGLVIDMEKHTHLLDQNKYLFETLMRKVNDTFQASRMKHEFRERRLFPMMMEVTAVASATDTTIAVNEPSYARRDQIIHNTRNGEIYLMNEDVGGTGTAGSITVVGRSGSGGIVAATQVGDKLQIVGETHAEGEAIPPAFSMQEVDDFDYCFQFDRTVKATDIEEAEEHYDSRKQRAIDRKMAWIEQKRALNLLGYIGTRTRETNSATGRRRHIPRGLNERLVTNKINLTSVPGGLTLGATAEILRGTKYHSQSSEDKISCCGQYAWASYSAMPEDRLRDTSGAGKKYGVRLNRIITGHGDLLIGYDPMLDLKHGLADRMYVLDAKHISRMILRNIPMVMKVNVNNASDIHNMIDVITGTWGLRLLFEELHAHVYNIT